ncbi:hypothetical protein BFINE_19040 [Bacteroides finegoldii DSM 17565]|nr:hypothetical protein BFINE_19040 [Bacteroides finegoldii DSM 17565]
MFAFVMFGLIFANPVPHTCISPLSTLLSRDGFMLFEVESHHDGLTDTFYFIRCGVNDPLDEMKAFRAYLGDSRLHSDVV